jgi:hypothetical protein
MSKDNDRPVRVNDGYQPELLEKGYQPVESVPISRPEPGAGYQPTSHGDNPTNVPSPPKER